MNNLSPQPRAARTGEVRGDKTPQPPTGGSIMAHISDHVLGDHPQRARRDLTTSWDHLLSAAGHGAKHVGQTSRRRARIARDRAETARLALLGEFPPSRSPWRWLGAGLAAGLAIGAAGATVLARARREADQTVTDQASAAARNAAATVREKASAGAEAVREQTRTVVQRATTNARGAAVEFRGKLIQRDPEGEPEPTDFARPPSVATSEQ
jgi:hypothetical protein